jgi:hypothetical protein
MATITFYAGNGTLLQNLSGSGLGFFGGAFGQSVELNAYQDTTFITNSNGTVEGTSSDNVKYVNDGSGYVTSITPATGLKFIPNNRATLNVRFSHGTAVKTQNTKLRIFDRVAANNPASGVWTKVAQLIHPWNTFGSAATPAGLGSGDEFWWGSALHASTPALGNQDVRLPNNSFTVGGSGLIVNLAKAPGPSGEYAKDGTGSTYQSVQHDWYLALSAAPKSIGSKTQYGLYVSLEYL